MSKTFTIIIVISFAFDTIESESYVLANNKDDRCDKVRKRKRTLGWGWIGNNGSGR